MMAWVCSCCGRAVGPGGGGQGEGCTGKNQLLENITSTKQRNQRKSARPLVQHQYPRQLAPTLHLLCASHSDEKKGTEEAADPGLPPPTVREADSSM
ncbi:hypothetical protein CB1_001512001 [Camelus ferus]|nr:hypothetical protein CB1_001512001 [Camelus ferus]